MPSNFRKVNKAENMVFGNAIAADKATSATFLRATSIESTLTIERRNFAWKAIIRDLGTYFEELYIAYNAASKGFEKACAALENTDKDPGLLLDASKLGVVRLVAALRDSKFKLTESYRRSAQDALDKADLLRQLREEIKQRNKNIKTEHASLNYKLSKAMETSPNSYIYSLDPEIDPWLSSISIQRQLHQGINDENNCNKLISLSFNSLSSFDASILRRIKSIVNAHIVCRNDDIIKTTKIMDHSKRVFENIPDDIEWKSFQTRYPHIVPDREACIRSIEDSKAQQGLASIREGYLGRKSGVGMFKSWKIYFCVLTSTGFLHGFGSKDFTCDAIPDFSINLRRSLVIVPGEIERDSPFSFVVTDTSSGGLFTNEKAYLLRADSQKDLNSWLSSLSAKVERIQNNIKIGNELSYSNSMISEEDFLFQDDQKFNSNNLNKYGPIQKINPSTLQYSNGGQQNNGSDRQYNYSPNNPSSPGGGINKKVSGGSPSDPNNYLSRSERAQPLNNEFNSADNLKSDMQSNFISSQDNRFIAQKNFNTNNSVMGQVSSGDKNSLQSGIKHSHSSNYLSDQTSTNHSPMKESNLPPYDSLSKDQPLNYQSPPRSQDRSPVDKQYTKPSSQLRRQNSLNFHSPNSSDIINTYSQLSKPSHPSPITVDKPLPESPHSSSSPHTPTRGFNFPGPPPASQITPSILSPVMAEAQDYEYYPKQSLR